jgi:hypothetical protein
MPRQAGCAHQDRALAAPEPLLIEVLPVRTMVTLPLAALTIIRKANSSTTSESKTGKIPHLSRSAHPSAKLLNSGTTFHALSSPQTSTTADIKAPHNTTDVKVPKIVQNTPT